jgi:hypothetical protein
MNEHQNDEQKTTARNHEVEVKARRLRKKKEPEEGSEESQGGEDEETDLQKFVANAVRAPRGGIYEHLLSQFMAQAVIVTDPLKRIKIVCEAALMIPEKDRENLAIDYDRLRGFNLVANALLHYTVRQEFYGKLPFQVISISWGFAMDEDNYRKLILPWIQYPVMHYPFLIRDKKHVEIGYDSYSLPIVKKCSCEPLWSYVFAASTCLAMEGYDSLRNSFAAWAIPQVQLYLTELTEIVNPTLYAEILGLTARGRKGYSEKVKETAEKMEEPTEGEA